MTADVLMRDLQAAIEKPDRAGGEVVADFSSVQRIDPRAVVEMEKLAGIADAKSVKVVLRGVPVDVYKVLKLANLSARFSFLA